MNRKNRSVKFYVVSDPHITYPTKSEERLSEDAITIFRDTLSEIVSYGSDFIFFTGDILESREFGMVNLDLAFSLMDSLTIPWLVLIGNHDLRYRSTLDEYNKDCFVKKFKGHGPNGKLAYWIREFPESDLVFIGLDTTIPGSAHGRIDEKQKKWLKTTLADIDQDRNVVVFTHHPFVLFDNEILVNDEMSVYLLENDQEIREIIEKNGNTKLVISGHNHTRRHERVNGIHYVGCPSINIWPTMYTKFNIENGKFFFSHIAIKDSSKTENSKKKIFTSDSHIVRILGSKEAAFNYYNRGPIKGKGVFS